MRKAWLFLPLWAAISMAYAAVAFGRDFPQPFEVSDPLRDSSPSESSWMPRGYAELAYSSHLLRAGPDDSFDVRALTSFTLVDVASAFALNLYWSGILLVGPLAEDDTAATVAEWWMNANQFEYGLVAGADLDFAHLSFEYSRTSQHPWRSGFSQVTTDALKASLALPGIESGAFVADLRCEVGYVDLFDFWKSSVPKPRTRWIASPALLLSRKRVAGVSPFLKLQLDTLLLRGGGADADFWAELGVRTGRGEARAEFFLDCCASNDTEEMVAGASPALLLGFGFRLAT